MDAIQSSNSRGIRMGRRRTFSDWMELKLPLKVFKRRWIDCFPVPFIIDSSCSFWVSMVEVICVLLMGIRWRREMEELQTFNCHIFTQSPLNGADRPGVEWVRTVNNSADLLTMLLHTFHKFIRIFLPWTTGWVLILSVFVSYRFHVVISIIFLFCCCYLVVCLSGGTETGTAATGELLKNR